MMTGPFNLYSGKVKSLPDTPTIIGCFRDAELLCGWQDVERSRKVEAALRADGVLPFKRLSLNGPLHQRLASMFVLLAAMPEGALLETRDQRRIHQERMPDKFLTYLDQAQSSGFITSEGDDKARGMLIATAKLKTLAAPLSDYEIINI